MKNLKIEVKVRVVQFQYQILRKLQLKGRIALRKGAVQSFLGQTHTQRGSFFLGLG